ncbi:Acyl-CoA:1-acyl-sn-glycerol-3-phosphate acyltransferase [hydrothermal vent metagenome]|uniref:Acyl-CoA:1-acyl-sn-glycerol-3-phosphate acyltransferase n=1 Tax=hydrothermal vent metagenome TaxID=652676 RepID=A0A3B0RLZ8_9ZZZZ
MALKSKLATMIKAGFILGKIAVSILPVMVVQSVLRKTSPQLARKFPQRYYSWLNQTMEARITVSGEPVTNQACLLISNHASWQDILLLGGTLPISFVAKSEVADWPIVGRLAKLGGTLFIDRARRQAAGETKNQMQTRLDEGGSLVLFPEGTTNDGNQILPFKSSLFGASQMEIDGKPVIVQPVSIAYQRVWGLPMGRERRTQFAWPGDIGFTEHLWSNLKSGPLDVAIHFHPATDIKQAGGRKQLAKLCEEQVRDGLANLIANSRAEE